MSDGVRSRRFGPPLLAALLAAGPVQAQIATDGSVGPKVSLRGGEIEIGADLGTRRGDNLFHSFEKFGIAPGQTATFTGPGAIKNVISRVTGGDISNIDGKLASKVGQADLYFLNPAGVMFGPNATLDVPGSFHVSTAHELRFADGARFSAVDKVGSGLTVAPPEAFGFLDMPPGRISVNQSQLQINPGKAFSLVGGNIDIAGGASGALSVPGGTVTLTSLSGAGQSRVSDGAVEGTQKGTIGLTDQARITTSANGGGTVRIRSGSLILEDATIAADNTGGQDSTSGIDLQASLLNIKNSRVSTEAQGSGRGGTVTIRADEMALRTDKVPMADGPLGIRSDTNSRGDAGSISVQANHLVISGLIIPGSVMPGSDAIISMISSDARTNSTGGNAGGVTVIVKGTLELRDGSQIRSNTQAVRGTSGHGTVEVRAGHLVISDFPSSIQASIQSTTSNPSGPTASAGSVTVIADTLELRNGGSIHTLTQGSGGAGTVRVEANRLFVSGYGSYFATGILSDAGFSLIAGEVSGAAGSVTVIVRGMLELHDGGVIRSDTWGTGKAGTVHVEADHLVISGYGNTGITSDTRAHPKTGANRSATSSAGNVTVTANTLELHDFGKISSLTDTVGDAGSVTIQANRLLIVGAGGEREEEGQYTGISTDARIGSAGTAGNVTVIVTGTLELRNGGVISSNTQATGKAGTVRVEADRLFASGDGSQSFTGISSATGGRSTGATGGRSTGAGGAVAVRAGTIHLRDNGAVSAESQGSGTSGNVLIRTGNIRLENGGTVTIASTGSGMGGALDITAEDTLELDNATVSTQTRTADASDVTLAAGHLMKLRDSSLSTSVGAGTGHGGSILIDAPLMIFDNSPIIANAQGGSGGNITIRAGQLIRPPDSKITASGIVNGNIAIAAPNTDISSSLVILPETLFDASSQLREACAARGGRPTSSLTAAGRGGLPPDPGTPLAASSFGQPLGQQTTTGSPTTLTARPTQAAKPITVTGIPQPVLGSPRFTCQG
jgi:filamentous hemagglutinin family protein